MMTAMRAVLSSNRRLCSLPRQQRPTGPGKWLSMIVYNVSGAEHELASAQRSAALMEAKNS